MGKPKSYPCPNPGCYFRSSARGDMNDHLATKHGEYSDPNRRQDVSYLRRRTVAVLQRELREEQDVIEPAETAAAYAQAEILAHLDRDGMRGIPARHPRPLVPLSTTLEDEKPSRAILAQDLANQRGWVVELKTWIKTIRKASLTEGDEEE